MKAKKLLDHALTLSKNEQILAESNFHLARYYHAQNQIVDAHRVSFYLGFGAHFTNV